MGSHFGVGLGCSLGVRFGFGPVAIVPHRRWCPGPLLPRLIWAADAGAVGAVELLLSAGVAANAKGEM